MKGKSFYISFYIFLLWFALTLFSCATFRSSSSTNEKNEKTSASIHTIAPPPVDYALRIPENINTTEKVVVVDPQVHVWGAYDGGKLIRAGLASAGSNWCRDLGRPCRTSPGTFRVYSLGGPGCISHLFPLPRGGAPMPYCMFFHGGQALHGVPEYEIGEGNFSHGCVRLREEDAEWLRYNFVNVGTKVIIKSY